MEAILLFVILTVLVERIVRIVGGGIRSIPQERPSDRSGGSRYSNDRVAAALVAGMYFGRQKKRMPRDPMDRDFPDPDELVSFGEL